MASRGIRAASVPALAAAFLAIACTPGKTAARTDAADAAASDTSAPAVAAANALPDSLRRGTAAPTFRPPAHLSPLADSISGFLVFVPLGETLFTASSRNRRMLVDIGRVDTEVRRDSARAAAYRDAVVKRSPIPIGTRFRLRGAWGAEDVVATGADSWNGRIVLRVSTSRGLDSLVRGKTPLVAIAVRADSAVPPAADSCTRGASIVGALAARVATVRDSLTELLRADAHPPYERLQRKVTVTSSQVTGCFGPARVALMVSLRAGNTEWVRERLMLVDTVGKAVAIRVTDYRFRAHDLLMAFDADGDGVDDLATRATTERAGATTILRLDLKARRATRLASGFAWEDQ